MILTYTTSCIYNYSSTKQQLTQKSWNCCRIFKICFQSSTLPGTSLLWIVNLGSNPRAAIELSLRALESTFLINGNPDGSMNAGFDPVALVNLMYLTQALTGQQSDLVKAGRQNLRGVAHFDRTVITSALSVSFTSSYNKMCRFGVGFPEWQDLIDYS